MRVKILVILYREEAKEGQPNVPVNLLVGAVEKAVSGAASDAPRSRLRVGPFPGHYYRPNK